MSLRLFVLLLLLATLDWPSGLGAAGTNTLNAPAEFERANKLYEQGKFAEAATAYEELLRAGTTSASAWFNLGNASYKSGQIGRAITAYRMAERLTPREAALRANLQFVQGKVYSDERTRVPWWKSVLRRATLNEWTALTAGAAWMFFAVLVAGEITRTRYPKTTAVFLLVVLLCGTGLGLAWRDQSGGREAVVVAREATARFGPLDESQAAFQLRDGAECAVLDVKGEWVQVRDPEKRSGWIRRDDVMILPGVTKRRGS